MQMTNKAVYCDSWKMDHSADVAAMAIVVEQEEEKRLLIGEEETHLHHTSRLL